MLDADGRLAGHGIGVAEEVAGEPVRLEFLDGQDELDDISYDHAVDTCRAWADTHKAAARGLYALEELEGRVGGVDDFACYDGRIDVCDSLT
jgi:hypothetical protein